ncbi:hypothetical protein LCI18_014600 [Fusarium solani-melongenae]|uniref:Uncharacterized protein n=1 Tax=Fusarium solani subsp. cucurbitae TaxID=2747967 RepID=A0ACD3ZR14_FUSSC|nr:hypothetical protein LCI18_014600 [Fusarium solani-melongenae]
MASGDDDYYTRDSWPKTPDGKDFDGTGLLNLVHKGSSPFKDAWDVNKLLQEIEFHTHAKVVDIPYVSKGSNNIGLHIKLSDQREILVRLGRGDINMPKYEGFSLDSITRELDFETAAYTLLAGHPGIPVSTLIHSRPPAKHEVGEDYDVEKSVQGRQLMVFDIPPGRSNVWWELLLPEGKPTRDFWLTVFRRKIEATIRNEGDMIGWEDDNNTVGTEALKAKQSLLRFLPHMLPSEENEEYLYRMVLEHGDFGIHNMSITTEADMKHAHITSLYDWETGCVWPAMLADPEMALTVDLIVDEDGKPTIKRVWEEATPDQRNEFMNHAKNYIKVLYQHAPDFERAIKAGKDARYLWFKLKDWRGDDPEKFFGELGAWAERRMAEKGV